MNIQIQYRKKKLYFNKRKDTTVISLKTQLFWLETRSLSNLHSPNRILRNNLYIWFFLPNLMILVYSFPSQLTVTASFCVFNTLSTVTSRHVSLPHSPSFRRLWSPLSKPSTPQPFRVCNLFVTFSSSHKHHTTLLNTENWDRRRRILMEMAQVKARARTALAMAASATSPKRRKISFVQIKSLSNATSPTTEERISGESPASCCSSNGSFDNENRIIKSSDLEVNIINKL